MYGLAVFDLHGRYQGNHGLKKMCPINVRRTATSWRRFFGALHVAHLNGNCCKNNRVTTAVGGAAIEARRLVRLDRRPIDSEGCWF